jgi:hypothetical protein
MEIMVTMNELALKLLPRVPSFPLQEMRDIPSQRALMKPAMSVLSRR